MRWNYWKVRPIGFIHQANLLIECRKIEQAIAVYQAAARLAEGLPDELGLQITLAHHLMNRKRFGEAGKVQDPIVD